jgi:hypothetical protein
MPNLAWLDSTPRWLAILGDPGAGPSVGPALDAAERAGMSRRHGGIHFESGDRHGRAAGATIGYWAYDKAKSGTMCYRLNLF